MSFFHANFGHKIPKSKRCVLALRVDLAHKKEHIIIGEWESIQTLSQGMPANGIWIEEVRPFGTLIEEIQTGVLPDIRNIVVDLLSGSDSEKQAITALEELYLSDNVVYRFVAIRLLQERRYGKKDSMLDHMEEIIRPMSVSVTNTILQWQDWREIESIGDAILSQEFLRGETKCVFFRERETGAYEESRVVERSVLPLLPYYLYSVYEKKAFLRRCAVCGKVFLSKSHRSTLCSEKCREEKQRKNQAAHLERVAGDAEEKSYINARAHFRYRLSRMREDPECSEMRIKAAEKTYKEFCKRALEKKKMVKSGAMTAEEYAIFLRGEEQKANQF